MATVTMRDFGRRALGWLAAGLILASLVAASATADDYDVVLRGGRVLDPETATDALLNVGIRGG